MYGMNRSEEPVTVVAQGAVGGVERSWMLGGWMVESWGWGLREEEDLGKFWLGQP